MIRVPFVRSNTHRRLWSISPLPLMLCAACPVIFHASIAWAQGENAPASAPATTPASYYGLWVLAPALVAIILAIVTRQVVVSLAFGILTASGMLGLMRGQRNPLIFITDMMDKYVLGVLAPVKDGRVDLAHLTILIYTLLIGAMIGVMTANGGTRAVVARVAHRVQTRQSAQFGAWIAGLLVFFDDYASAMIVGPGLRPLFDRVRLSREKLAHIVNWTAAPPASIFLSTWLAVQIGLIDDGLKLMGDHNPAFLAGQTGANIFWATIPFRTYTLLTIVMVLFIALTGRDFGGMRRAESLANAPAPAPAIPPPAMEVRSHSALGGLPVITLVALTLALMVMTGLHASGKPGALPFRSTSEIWSSLQTILGKADSNFSLLYASLGAAVVAVLITVLSRSLSLAKTMEGVVAGMSHMFAASIILVLAWGLSQASKDLQLGEVARQYLQQQIDLRRFSIEWLPSAVFVTTCLVSFSIGTAWGTMGILLPPVVAIAGGLLAGQPSGQAMTMFYATVGAAMAGSIFGNTCSPLADVTVLSSMFSGCDLAAHVRTVLSYALVVALTSIACTDGARWALQKWAPAYYPHWNVWYGLGTGALLLLLILLIAGRRPRGLVIEPAVLYRGPGDTRFTMADSGGSSPL